MAGEIPFMWGQNYHFMHAKGYKANTGVIAQVFDQTSCDYF